MASRYQVEHRRIPHRGRMFHFVSYDGQPANAKEAATDAAWFLVNAGYRWKALPQQAGQEVEELDDLLTEWLETHVFADAGPEAVPAP